METVILLVVGLGAIASALYTVASRHPIYGAISLIAHNVCLGGLYIWMGSEVLGILQILIYGGAIVVLFLYACMYVGPEATTETMANESKVKIFFAAIAALSVFVIASVCITLTSPAAPKDTTSVVRSYHDLSLALFRDFLVPFEVVSILLLVAIIGAIYLSRAIRKRPASDGGEA